MQNYQLLVFPSSSFSSHWKLFVGSSRWPWCPWATSFCLREVALERMQPSSWRESPSRSLTWHSCPCSPCFFCPKSMDGPECCGSKPLSEARVLSKWPFQLKRKYNNKNILLQILFIQKNNNKFKYYQNQFLEAIIDYSLLSEINT